VCREDVVVLLRRWHLADAVAVVDLDDQFEVRESIDDAGNPVASCPRV
jgi:hypothetical protein